MPLDRERMRKLRLKLYANQQAAADAAGLGSKQRWSNIEAGTEANVTVEILERIAKALRVKPAELLTTKKETA